MEDALRLLHRSGFRPRVVIDCGANCGQWFEVASNVFADAEFQKTFLDRYLFQSIAGTPEELMTFVRSEEPKWRKIIQDANIKVQQ